MIFVDTGAWFALSVESDPDHESAKRFVSDSTEPLITSDYVIDELLTLFIVRREKAKGRQWLRDVLEAGGVAMVWVDPESFRQACRLYTEFADKKWSFTDCTSYAVMQRLHIDKAFSFDEDFRNLEPCRWYPRMGRT